MAQIGTFTRDESGAYSGPIKTLTSAPLDLQPKGPEQREGWRDPSVCFAMESPEKGLDAGKHETTAIARLSIAHDKYGSLRRGRQQP